MDTENGLGNGKIATHDSAAGMQTLAQVPTSVTLSAEQFEKLYLNPLNRRQPEMTKRLGNPTPLGLGAFILTATPLSCSLMGWRGAEGNGIAFTGVLVLFGGILLVISSILEFLLSNTFSCVVFGQLGAFCLAFGATMTPAFNSAAPFSQSGSNTFEGLESPGFVNTFAFFFISMAILMIVYMLCATRTNIVYVLIFFSLIIFFALAAAAYWRMGAADKVSGERLVVGSGGTLFFTSMCGWYIFTAQLLTSVGFPLLPIGDLSHLWNRGKSGGNREKDMESSEASDK